MRLPAERQCIFPDHGKLVACCPRGAYLWAASPLRRCLRAERWEADTLSDIVASFRRGENEPANSLDQRRFARRRPCQFLRARAAKHVERRGRRARDALSGGLDLKDNRGARRAVACDRRAVVARRGCCAVSQVLAAAGAAARLIKVGHAASSVRNDRRLQCPRISRLPLGRTTARRCADPSRRSTRKFAVAMRIVDCDMRRIADMDVSSCLKFERRFCNT